MFDMDCYGWLCCSRLNPYLNGPLPSPKIAVRPCFQFPRLPTNLPVLPPDSEMKRHRHTDIELCGESLAPLGIKDVNIYTLNCANLDQGPGTIGENPRTSSPAEVALSIQGSKFLLSKAQVEHRSMQFLPILRRCGPEKCRRDIRLEGMVMLEAGKGWGCCQISVHAWFL